MKNTQDNTATEGCAPAAGSPVLPTVAPWVWHSIHIDEPEPPQQTRELLIVLDGSLRGVPDTIAVGWKMVDSAGRPTGWWKINGSSVHVIRVKYWAELPSLPLANVQSVAQSHDQKA